MITIKETVAVKDNGTLVLRRPESKAGDIVNVTLQMKGKESSSSGKLKQDWAGGMGDLAGKFTSTELQHKASEWRADGE